MKRLGSPAGRLAAKPRRTKERRNQEFPVVVKKEEEGRPNQVDQRSLAPPNEREIEKLFVRKGGKEDRCPIAIALCGPTYQRKA